MVATRKLEIQFTGDTTSAGRAFHQVGQDADRTESRMSRWSTGIAGAIGFAFATDAIVSWGSTLISAAEEAQQVTRQTDAVIASMGASSWASAKGVAELAEKISLKTGLDDEMIQSGENVLLTFGNVRNEVGRGNDVFDRATKVATDMSVAMGSDLNSAMVQIGKALNDPIAGLTALTRVGVQFTDEQKNMITTMVEAGDTMGAQQIVLAELERQFGGSAEAQATASSKMKVAWDNIVETLGTLLLPTFEKVSTWLATTLPIAMDIAIGWVKANQDTIKQWAIVIGVIAVAALTAYTVASVYAAIATASFSWPVLLAVVAVIALAAAAIYAYTHIGFFRQLVDDAADSMQELWKWVKDNKELFEQLGPVLKVVVIGQMIVLLGIVIALAAGVRAMTAAWQGWIAAIERAVGALQRVGSAIKSLPGMGGGGFLGGVVKGLIPGLATGGIVTAPTLAMVGESGPEAIIPLNRAGGLGSGPTVIVNVSGNVLSERDLFDALNSGMQKGYRLHSSGREL
jgi:hypothetical protein